MQKNTHFIPQIKLTHCAPHTGTHANKQLCKPQSQLNAHYAHNNVDWQITYKVTPMRKQKDCSRTSQWSTECTVKTVFNGNPHCLFLLSPLLLAEQWAEPRGRSFHSARTGVILKKMVREGPSVRAGPNQPSCIICPFYIYTFLTLKLRQLKPKAINRDTQNLGGIPTTVSKIEFDNTPISSFII